MSQYSRVKKYEDLHNATVIDEDDKVVMSALEDFDKVANKVENKVQEPIHKKVDTLVQPVEETGNFKNEYIDSFLQEVRDYNMKQGLRENENTRLDILQQLSAKQREKRASYIEDRHVDVQEPSTPTHIETDIEDIESQDSSTASTMSMDTTMEIAKQVQQLLEDESSLQQDVVEEVVEDDIDEVLLNDVQSSRLLEETMKLKVQLDEYEEELNSLNDGVDKNNHLLNIVIAVLIFMLVGVISIIIYWLVNGGIL